MTMTPYDFSMLIGIEVGGRPIPYDTDMGEWEAAWVYLLGAHPPIFRSGMVHVYDWGGAGLATLYGYMSSMSRRSGNRVGGY
ncbi:hypothetical protein ACSBR2_025701 [Camellia fascicularis]